MIKIKIQGLEELQRDLDKAPDKAKKYLGDAIEDSSELVRQNVRREAPVFQGDLKRNIEKDVFRQRLRGEVFVGGEAIKYGYVQEYGRKPGSRMPPPKALEKWAKIKLGDSRLAFPVARSIARKGTRKQPFFQPGAEKSERGVFAIFEKAISKFVESI